MMLASLSSYCQYPTVKTIGKDTVVIMTLKQGEEINKKFSSLNDSIRVLNNSITQSKSEVVVLNAQKLKVDSSLILASDKLFVSEKEIKRLNDALKLQDKKQWVERKNWAGWMFFSFAITVMVASLK